MMFKEYSSDVGTPKSSELKGRHLTLAKRQLHKNTFHGKPKLSFDIEIVGLGGLAFGINSLVLTRSQYQRLTCFQEKMTGD